ncbi:MAG TPA: class I SAM-dependent methyltransferase [Acidimicrobiia bacterium]
MSEEAWETHAGWWQREYTDGADPEYEEQLLPLVDRHLAGAERVLDVGCGEGQVARRVCALGAGLVAGVDPTAAQLAVARERGGGPQYVRGVAEALPWRAGSFDAVVVSLVLEHVDPFETAVAEIARVLVPGGKFVLLLNHPLLQTPDSGFVIDHDLGEQYWRLGAYLRDDRAMEEVAPGVELTFLHRPLYRYVNCLAEHGLLVEHMDEPPPPAGFLELAPEYAHAATIPRLLVLVTRKHVS